MASRLSYMVLASMPDADLFAAAAAGKLREPDQIAEQAKRLLASDKAKVGLGEFVTQWLHVTSVPTLSKDETYTNYNAGRRRDDAEGDRGVLRRHHAGHRQARGPVHLEHARSWTARWPSCTASAT